MPRTQTGPERARELRRIRDELDSLADDWRERLWHARGNDGEAVGEAMHAFARYRATLDVVLELVAERPADVPSELLELERARARLDRHWRQSWDAWEEKHLAPAQEEYIGLTVDAEIGPDVLARLNAARDAVRGELATVVRGLTSAERRAFLREEV